MSSDRTEGRKSKKTKYIATKRPKITSKNLEVCKKCAAEVVGVATPPPMPVSSLIIYRGMFVKL